jgi:penicillin-binding protein 1A
LAKKTSFFTSALKWLTLLATLGLVIVIAAGFAVYSHFEAELPDIKVLRNVEYQIPMKVYSQEGLLLGQFGDRKRIPVTIDDVPTQQINAFLAAEDSNFYDHKGVDFKAILRAGWQLLRTGKKKQGGSTITMQVTRNFLLTRDKTFTRKIKEIILALKIDGEFSKQTILELYMNKIFLGHRSYGIASAAQTYYGKNLTELNLAEQAMIAGLPKAPSHFNPITDSKRAIQRRNYVLDRMLALNFISQKQYVNAIILPPTAKLHTQKTEISAPYLAEMVRHKIVSEYGDAAYSSGMKIFTTLKADLQTTATKALRDSLHEFDDRHGYRVKSHPSIKNGDAISDTKNIGSTIPAVINTVTDDTVTAELRNQEVITIPWKNLKSIRRFKTINYTDHPIKTPHEIVKTGDIIRIRLLDDKTWKLSQDPEIEGAFVALNPTNGAILAISGGYDFYNSKYNRATQSSRQPGSGFKPIIYTTALENGFTAASIINDAPIVIDDPNLEAEWRPENYSHKFFGPTRLRTALRKSRNLISIRLLKKLGIAKVRSTAIRFGFNPKQLPNSLTLALGSGQATPLQMARLFSVFANGGFRVTPFFIDRIESKTGDILFRAEPEVACSTCNNEEINEKKYAPRIISPLVNFIMNTMLRDVVQRGTATRANKLGRKDLAGKTGTTNEQRDAWFNGYSSSIAATAWVGFDEPSPLGKSETGGRAALPIWIKFMEKALKDQPETELIKPQGIVNLLIDPETGLRAQDGKGILEYFSSTNVPTEYAPVGLDSQNSEDTVEEIF